MKFKLDENFGMRTLNVFREADYEAHTVREEGLAGAVDLNIYETCRREQRCLITLDLDFSDVTRFPPRKTAGIIVIRLPNNPTLSILEALVRQCLNALKQNQIEGRLWIVEPGRIRIHQSDAED